MFAPQSEYQAREIVTNDVYIGHSFVSHTNNKKKKQENTIVNGEENNGNS